MAQPEVLGVVLVGSKSRGLAGEGVPRLRGARHTRPYHNRVAVSYARQLVTLGAAEQFRILAFGARILRESR
jgi:hypothetical protein